MRLICINNGPIRNDIGIVHSAPQLEEGEYYTVLKENKYAYHLVEVDTPEGHCGYGKARFIPTSDTDEVQEVEKLLRYLESDFYERFNHPLK